MALTPGSYTVSRRRAARRIWEGVEAPLWARIVLYLYGLSLPARRRRVEIIYTRNGDTE